MPKLHGNGILVTGDAAGLNLNTGLTVRGMEFAIASGVFAGRAIKQAEDAHDLSKAPLNYDRQMKDSFVLKDMYTFRDAPSFLENPRLFNVYPQVLCDTMGKLMAIGEGPKRKLTSTAMQEIRSKLGWSWLKELRGALKV
jgi:electron transfer flavoprotein-quinone oxidoreductase